MNYAQSKGRSRVLFFFSSLALGLGLAVGAAIIARSVVAVPSVGPASVSGRTCEAILKSEGFKPSAQGDIITVRQAGTKGLEALVLKAGVLIASCPDYQLQSFCAGEKCSLAGLSFTLKNNSK